MAIKKNKESEFFKGYAEELTEEFIKDGSLKIIPREKVWMFEDQLSEDFEKIKRDYAEKEKESRALVAKFESVTHFI